MFSTFPIGQDKTKVNNSKIYNEYNKDGGYDDDFDNNDIFEGN